MLPMMVELSAVHLRVVTILEKNGLINRFFAHFGLGPFEMINTQGAVVLGMIYNYLPFMILPLYSIMTKIPNSVIEAAQDLGANARKVLTKVLIPMTVPASRPASSWCSSRRCPPSSSRGCSAAAETC